MYRRLKHFFPIIRGCTTLNRYGIFNIILFSISILINIFGQDFAYFLDKTINHIGPIYYLTILTIISISIYIILTIIAAIKYIRKTTEFKETSKSILYLGIWIGLFSCFWSFFVLATWWS